ITGYIFRYNKPKGVGREKKRHHSHEGVYPILQKHVSCFASDTICFNLSDFICHAGNIWRKSSG
ncbi:MAG: hypothetical protein WC637_14940, partial [Victivallales bacterium]